MDTDLLRNLLEAEFDFMYEMELKPSNSAEFKAKGPGQGTRYRTQKRDEDGTWTDGPSSPSTSKPKPEAPKPAPPASVKPATAESLGTYYQEQNKDMPDNVRVAFDDYINGTAFDLNANLRQGNGPEDAAVTMAGVDEGMRPLPAPAKVYRGLDQPWEEIFGEAPQVGAVIEDKGYMSTSTNRDVAERFSSSEGEQGVIEGAVLEISVPAGVRAMDMGSVPGAYLEDEESELVLARGQKMRITEVSQVYWGYNYETGQYEPDPDRNDPDGYTLTNVKADILVDA